MLGPLVQLLLQTTLLQEDIGILMLKWVILLIVVLFFKFKLVVTLASEFLRVFVLIIHDSAALIRCFVRFITILDRRPSVLRIIDLRELRAVCSVLLLVEVQPPGHSFIIGSTEFNIIILRALFVLYETWSL